MDQDRPPSARSRLESFESDISLSENIFPQQHEPTRPKTSRKPKPTTPKPSTRDSPPSEFNDSFSTLSSLESPLQEQKRASPKRDLRCSTPKPLPSLPDDVTPFESSSHAKLDFAAFPERESPTSSFVDDAFHMPVPAPMPPCPKPPAPLCHRRVPLTPPRRSVGSSAATTAAATAVPYTSTNLRKLSEISAHNYRAARRKAGLGDSLVGAEDPTYLVLRARTVDEAFEMESRQGGSEMKRLKRLKRFKQVV